MPNNYTASVKVMRSHDYCHFEVNLGTTEPLDLAGVDAMRKDAARLADKAVKQYQIAKRTAERARSGAQTALYRKHMVEPILARLESERSDEEKAILKEYEDASFAASRRYDYDDEDDQDYGDED